MAGILLCLLAIGADPDGFQPLFNGKNLDGWTREGEAGFVATPNGELLCTGRGDYPTWLRSNEQFENFELHFEYLLNRYGEGGVFLHAPLHGRNSNVGIEIQLSDDTRNPRPVTISSGAIFGAIPPTEQASAPLGQWNRVEVLCDWPTLKVTLNGKLVQELNCEEDERLRNRFRFGYLGIQDRGKFVRYRNFRIRTLPDKDRGQWRDLFDGTSLKGWHILQPEEAQWSVEEGQIVARNGNGYLVTDDQFQDFQLHAYIQTSPLANGGIFVRWKSLVPKDRGYEIQIEDIPDSNNPTGSVYDLARADQMPYTPGEWYPIFIEVRGQQCVVVLNGAKVVDTDELTLVRPGNIALQMHRQNSWIRFKDLRIKPLAPSP